jgi:hypothetical protein
MLSLLNESAGKKPRDEYSDGRLDLGKDQLSIVVGACALWSSGWWDPGGGNAHRIREQWLTSVFHHGYGNCGSGKAHAWAPHVTMKIHHLAHDTYILTSSSKVSMINASLVFLY